jgi:peptide/nickel transport system ATP-binding protein
VAANVSREQREVAAPSPRAPLLAIRDLSTHVVSHGRRIAAVDGVSLTVGLGEVVALVGESGSGKSMTALSVMRLLPPQAQVVDGSVELGGVDLLALPERRMNDIRGRKIALLFQQPRAALDPTSKVGTQVSEALRIHHHVSRRGAWERGVGLLAEVGIPEPRKRANAYVHQMSGGMAQRIMIAAALSGEPALLIADEPTTSLDVTVQAQILKLLVTECRAAKLSLLLITHDLAIVSAIADRIAVMYCGRIVEEGSAAEILESPQHPYTIALLQSSLLTPSHDGRLYTIPGRSASRELDCGCRFCDRCDVAVRKGIRDHCAGEEPALAETGPAHRTRCWAVGGPS